MSGSSLKTYPDVTVFYPVRGKRAETLKRNCLLLFFGVLIILGGILAHQRQITLTAIPRATALHTVSAGETLWNISRVYAPHADPRKTVYEIRNMNGLDDSPVIYPGQVLVVPAEGE